MKSGSDSAVIHGGSQQNGPILGNGCALYLTKFMTTLVLKYKTYCSDS